MFASAFSEEDREAPMGRSTVSSIRKNEDLFGMKGKNQNSQPV